MAVTSIAAAVFSVVAIALSVLTYLDQQQLGDSQISLNEASQLRIEQRYASRVAWWMEDRPVGTNEAPAIVVQNRSPVPIRHVYLGIPTTVDEDGVPGPSDVRQVYFIGDLPPCSVRSFTFNDHDLGLELVSKTRSLDYAWDLHFTDPTGFWVLKVGRLERAGWSFGLSSRDMTPLADSVVASDCGEGG